MSILAAYTIPAEDKRALGNRQINTILVLKSHKKCIHIPAKSPGISAKLPGLSLRLNYR